MCVCVCVCVCFIGVCVCCVSLLYSTLHVHCTYVGADLGHLSVALGLALLLVLLLELGPV